MKGYRILSNAASDADIEAAFEWYESEQPGLGLEFLNEIRATHLRILDEPLKYAVLRSGIRRAITRRFPYGIYFSIEDAVVLIIAVLHTARDPAEWQFRV